MYFVVPFQNVNVDTNDHYLVFAKFSIVDSTPPPTTTPLWSFSIQYQQKFKSKKVTMMMTQCDISKYINPIQINIWKYFLK
jgi:hypothetical protein